MSLPTLLSEHSVGVALVAALASACTFALGTSLQHRAGGATPHDTQGVVRILRFLVTQPSWVLGISFAAVGLVLHALALNFGSLAIVQPMMVAGVALAVPLRAALSKHRPSRREMIAVLITTVGLALFMVAANPEPHASVPGSARTLMLVLVATGFAAAMALIGSRMRRHKTEALLHGVASGIAFGLSAALLKVLVVRASEFGLLGLMTWHLAGLAVIGALGMSCNQRAYRIARLSASMPASNVVAVLTAIFLGSVMFGEAPSSGALPLIAQCIALGCMAIGLRRIARLRGLPDRVVDDMSSVEKAADRGDHCRTPTTAREAPASPPQSSLHRRGVLVRKLPAAGGGRG